MALALGGCSSFQNTAEQGAGRLQTAGVGNTFVTTATVRAIVERNAEVDKFSGINTPTTITCAEPSPDVALAVQEAFASGTSGAADVLLPSGISAGGDLTVAISRSRAEAVAQLGERLATMQLLRDALFRACEAFMNGAVGPATYALIVGRIDKTMVSLLYGELAAGAFGRQGASAGGTVVGAAQAARARDAAKAIVERIQALDEERQNISQLQNRLARAETDVERITALTDLNTVAGRLSGIQADVRRLAEEGQSAVEVAAAASGATGSGQGQGKLEPQGAAAGSVLQGMHDRYFDQLGLDAWISACITELSRTAVAEGQLTSGIAVRLTNPSALAVFCHGIMNDYRTRVWGVVDQRFELERAKARAAGGGS